MTGAKAVPLGRRSKPTILSRTTTQSNDWRPMLGFKTFRSAARALAGIEIMHVIRKGRLKATAAYKVPQNVVFLDSLPRNATEKVKRHECGNIFLRRSMARPTPYNHALNLKDGSEMSYTLTGFEGKVAVVTGAGRMRSIGRPIALILAQAGCDVVLTGTGRPAERYPEDERAVNWRDIESVADEIRQLGRCALAVVSSRSSAV
jgi:hypothetical protein